MIYQLIISIAMLVAGVVISLVLLYSGMKPKDKRNYESPVDEFISLVHEPGEIYDVILQAIEAFDPLDVMFYELEDEYIHEAKKIYDGMIQYADKLTVGQLAKIIKNVFRKSFSKRYSSEDCLNIAEYIYGSLGVRPKNK